MRDRILIQGSRNLELTSLCKMILSLWLQKENNFCNPIQNNLKNCSALSHYHRNRKPLNLFARRLLVLAGTVSLGLGTLGILIPLLPTTPFLLLTAACYIRSSERLYKWLMDHRLYGKFLHNYLEKRAISLNVKIGSLTLLWVTIITSSLFFLSVTWLQILLIIKAVLVTLHILSFKTMR